MRVLAIYVGGSSHLRYNFCTAHPVRLCLCNGTIYPVSMLGALERYSSVLLILTRCVFFARLVLGMMRLCRGLAATDH
jgi:hypothetical protein